MNYRNLIGFTLIEVLTSVFLVGIIFLSIFGVYQIGLKIINLSKNKIIATNIANQKIEMIRNLNYDDIGTINGIPNGSIPETEIITRNKIDFTVKTTIVYIDDPYDGIAPTDQLPTDYKRAKIKVSWPGLFGGYITLFTDISPKGIESDIGGGTLIISVFNAFGSSVAQANLHILNTQVNPNIDAWYYTDSYGNLIIPGSPTSTQAYQITVDKNGYSSDRTYGTDEVANPLKPHASVFTGQVTNISFSIDKVSSLSINTQAPESERDWSDSFLNQDKVSELNNVYISEGEVKLGTTTDGEYFSSGYLISTTITPNPENFLNWKEFSFTDNEPSLTDLKYQFLYPDTTSSWALIPDADLQNNSIGFDDSPVDISGISKEKYPEIRLRANFSTNTTSTTPTLFDWIVTYKTNQSQKIGNVTFNLKGSKIIGTDVDKNPIYKYSQDHTTNQNGHIDIQNLEWDSYSFSVDKAITGLDLISTEPNQPIDLLPNTNKSVVLNLKAENTLLITVKDYTTLDPVFAASVRVYNTDLGYDQLKPTDENGKAFFIPLEKNIYNLEIQGQGYQTWNGTITISGDTTKIIKIQKSE